MLFIITLKMNYYKLFSYKYFMRTQAKMYCIHSHQREQTNFKS